MVEDATGVEEEADDTEVERLLGLLGVSASSSSLDHFTGRVLARDFSGEPLDPFVEEDLQHAVVLQVEESMTAPGVGVGESH